MHTTNYYDTFIAIAPDSDADRGVAPPERKSPSIALLTFRIIRDHPYRYTSDEVMFTLFSDRMGLAPEKRPAARESFFSKPQPCFRASDLTKKYGWGVHSDSEARVALYGVETPEYDEFVRGKRLGAGGEPITVKHAMRTRRS